MHNILVVSFIIAVAICCPVLAIFAVRLLAITAIVFAVLWVGCGIVLAFGPQIFAMIMAIVYLSCIAGGLCILYTIMGIIMKAPLDEICPPPTKKARRPNAYKRPVLVLTESDIIPTYDRDARNVTASTPQPESEQPLGAKTEKILAEVREMCDAYGIGTGGASNPP